VVAHSLALLLCRRLPAAAGGQSRALASDSAIVFYLIV